MNLSALRQYIAKLTRLDSLRAKLQLAVAILMMASLLITTVTFVISTVVTQTRLLRAQTTKESSQIIEALEARVDNLRSATQMLAADPSVAEAVRSDSEDALQTLNARAVAVRDRFNAGLIQIYNADGVARTNLLLSSLYRESTLLDQVKPNQAAVKEINERVILMHRAELPDGLGSVITGVDLETELDELVQRYRLSADPGLVFEPSTASDQAPQVSTVESFPFETRVGRGLRIYSRKTPLRLGDREATLIMVRSTADIRDMTATGLAVMIVSTTLTTVLLLIVSMQLTRAITRPIHQLSETANDVAAGNFQRRNTITAASFLKVGQNDEIGALTTSFNYMVDQLQDLYAHLESRVKTRTQELATAAEIARLVSSSLDLDVILHQVAHALRRRVEADIVAFFLIDEDARVAELEHVSGDDYPLAPGEVMTLEAQTPVSAAAKLHAACLVSDTERTSRYLPTSWYPKIRSAIAVPLMAGNRVIGILELQSKIPGKFDPETANLLNTLADQIATGIQNAQRYSEEQRRRRFTEVLELTGRILSGSLDMHELPGRALSSLKALVDYERGSLWMARDRRLEPLAQYGYIDERPIHKKRLGIDADLYTKIAEDRRPMMIDDVREQSKWEAEFWLPGDRSWLGVPIITATGKIIGLVSLTSSEIAFFDTDDAVWVQAFASQAGIALENANLYAEIARSGEEAPLRTSVRITSHPNVGNEPRYNATHTS
jgi:GAF domain-containing protein/HAMP domain-containing protein